MLLLDKIKKDIKKLKALRPHSHDYPQTATDYRHTDNYTTEMD